MNDFLDQEVDYFINKSIFINFDYLAPNYSLRNIDDILHREDEIKTFFQFLKVIFKNYSPQNIFIHGKMGVGKSLLTKWALDSVQQKAKQMGIELCVIYIDCRGVKTENGIWQTITDNLLVYKNEKWETQHITENQPKMIGNSPAKHYANFKNFVNNYSGVIIIVLDEIDKAKKPDMINEIIRIESIKSDHFPCVIGITNDLYIEKKFSTDLLSVLKTQELLIKPYNADALFDITKARYEMAFKPETLDNNVIPLIAAFAASEDGEARRAIDLLRVAGKLTDDRHGDLVLEEDVRKANTLVAIERVKEMISSLPTHSKLILLACIFVYNYEKEKTTSSAYEVYKKYCRYIDIDELTNRRINDLLKELDTLNILDILTESKGRYGRSTSIKKIEDKDIIESVLYEDFRLESLKDAPKENFRLYNFKI